MPTNHHISFTYISVLKKGLAKNTVAVQGVDIGVSKCCEGISFTTVLVAVTEAFLFQAMECPPAEFLISNIFE